MVILIDNGHGKDTQFKAKFSPTLKNSGIKIDSEFTYNDRFREWKYNRVIAKQIVDILKEYGYDARLVVKEDSDISLADRISRINKVCKQYGASNVLMISIHSNAVGNGSSWMAAQGWECYTTKGTTTSDKLAEFLYKRAEKNFKGRKIRKDTSDGDSDKESSFYIIKNANCASVLTENFFYDNKDDLKYITSDEGVQTVVRTHIEGIIDFVENKDENKKK